jgi:putative Mg2+ transporter-C (MgtC) family protein
MEDVLASEMALRIGLSLLVGLVLGFEREQHGRAAGMRTTMLVCVSSAVVMMLSQHLFFESSQGLASWRPDPARLAAGVLAGMGFLGAGVIMRQDQAIHGVTTAAVLWFSAILGMAFGSGTFGLGFAGFGVVAIALFVLPSFESSIPRDRYAVLSVACSAKGPSQAGIVDAVHALNSGAKLKAAGLEWDAESKTRRMLFDVKIKNRHLAEGQAKTVALVTGMAGVKKVSWR